MRQEWITFELNHTNPRDAFENLTRKLFNLRFFNGKGLFHSNPNNPGVEIEPVLHEESGERISFQSKYLDIDGNHKYSELKKSMEAMVSEYSGMIDVVYVYCNYSISKRNQNYRNIENYLQENKIRIVPICDKQILDEAGEYPRIYEKYFGKTLSEKLDLIISKLGLNNNMVNVPVSEWDNKPFVFINYAHKDRVQVFYILNELRKKGLRYWCDLDLEYGEDYPEIIQNVIDSSNGVISFISSSINSSKWCKKEIRYSIDQGITPFIPFYLEDVKLKGGLDLELAGMHKLRYQDFDGLDIMIQRLINELHSRIPEVFNLEIIDDDNTPNNIENLNADTSVIENLSPEEVFPLIEDDELVDDVKIVEKIAIASTDWGKWAGRLSYEVSRGVDYLLLSDELLSKKTFDKWIQYDLLFIHVKKEDNVQWNKLIHLIDLLKKEKTYVICIIEKKNEIPSSLRKRLPYHIIIDSQEGSEENHSAQIATCTIVEQIYNILRGNSLVNLDFADICHVINKHFINEPREGFYHYLRYATKESPTIPEYIQKRIEGASVILLFVKGGYEMGLVEVNDAGSPFLQNDEADVIVGVQLQEDFPDDEIEVFALGI